MIFRKRNKLSRKELADIVGISAATVANYEQGKTLPSAEITVKLAIALNVSVNDLIVLNDPKKTDTKPMTIDLDPSDDVLPDYLKLLNECNTILQNKNITIK